MKRRLLSILLAAFWLSTAQASTQAWQTELNAQSTWSRLTYAGTLMMTDAFRNSVAKRYSAAKKARTTAFFLTKEDKAMVLLGIDLADGSEVGRIPMDEKEPQFMVDAIGNRVYYFRNKTRLVAYDF